MPKAIIPSFRKAKKAILSSLEGVVLPKITELMTHEMGSFQDSIRRQNFPAATTVPLSPRYAALKKRKGLDHRVLVSTKTYVNSLQVIRTHSPLKRRRYWAVDFDRNAMARGMDRKRTLLPLRALAVIHEHGSATEHVPARPHWRPFWMRASPRIKAGVLAAAAAGVRRANKILKGST